MGGIGVVRDERFEGVWYSDDAGDNTYMTDSSDWRSSGCGTICVYGQEIKLN